MPNYPSIKSTGPAVGAEAILDLNDVVLTSPVLDEVLTYDGTNWINKAASGGGGNNWIEGNNGVDFTTAPQALGTNSLALGEDAQTLAGKYYGIAIGFQARALDDYAIAIGGGNGALYKVTAHHGIGIGNAVIVSGDNGVAIGSTSKVTGANGVAIGPTSQTNNQRAIAIGQYANSSHDYAISIGYGINSSENYEISMGRAGTNQFTVKGNGNMRLVGSKAQFVMPSYTVATLPTGTTGGMVFVTDETGGSIPAFYDGTNWRRVTDRAVVA